MTTKKEVWTTVWVVYEPPGSPFGVIAGMYTTEAAAREHEASGTGYTVKEWAASNVFHKS